MAPSVALRERDLYARVFKDVDRYADFSPGEARVGLFCGMANLAQGELAGISILDAGCGTGKGAVALAAAGCQDVRLCDLTDQGLVPAARHFPFYHACLWDDLIGRFGYGRDGRVDYVFCADVLEHVPPEFTMLVVARLLAITRRAIFLSIATVPDAFGVLVGEPLHKTVMPFTWWRNNLAALGEVLEARDLLSSGVYLVKPRC